MTLQDKTVTKLREAIKRYFPANTYLGKLTPVDLQWTEELDEEKALYESLKGKNWTQIPGEILDSLPSGYMLLTDQAFPLFFPAWLMRCLEQVSPSEIQSFLIYSFSPKRDLVPDTTNLAVRKLKILNCEQLSTLRYLIDEISNSHSSEYVRELATKAIALIDEVSVI
ncbi:MAG: hypothetical protein JSS95_00020 [Acidobacteria bacterium]|nr:hypothetical protein [Acidobacteriota bacterium]